jgi:hypothetical protein
LAAVAAFAVVSAAATSRAMSESAALPAAYSASATPPSVLTADWSAAAAHSASETIRSRRVAAMEATFSETKEI